MTVLDMLLVFIAGMAAGAINSVLGSGTLVTFPTLIALGVPPVTASMSNSLGLVLGSASGTWGYRRELTGQWGRLRWQLPASLSGALIGAFLLLHLPADAFESVVPVLIGLAVILVAFQPRIQRALTARRSASARVSTSGTDGSTATVLRRSTSVQLFVGTFLVGIYGGYFTAAQGILLVAIMGMLLTEDMQRINAAKNLLSMGVNVVAATTYVLVASDRINWTVAGLIAGGALIGGMLGSSYGRRIPAPTLRLLIVLLGVVALTKLLVFG
jgi:uncharacterized membrane protein YfcA